MIKVFLWRALALLCVALGLIGVVLPGMPTVVFMLVAAWAGARGWPRLESWLLDHPRYGPPILHWRERGAISRRGKCAASTMMLVSIGIIALRPDVVAVAPPGAPGRG